MAPKSTPDNGNYPARKNHSGLPGVLDSLKSFKCIFTAANYHANKLPKTWNVRNGMKRMTDLQNVNPTSPPVKTTQGISSNCEFRTVAESNALNFDHISHLG